MMMSNTGNGSGWRLISAAETRPKWTGRERRVMGHVVLMARYPCVLVSAPGAEEPPASEKPDGDNKPETHRMAAGSSRPKRSGSRDVPPMTCRELRRLGRTAGGRRYDDVGLLVRIEAS